MQTLEPYDGKRVNAVFVNRQCRLLVCLAGTRSFVEHNCIGSVDVVIGECVAGE